MPDLSARTRKIRKIVNVVRRGARHPSWLRETLGGRGRSSGDRVRPFSLMDHREHVMSAEQAVVAAYGTPPAEFQALHARIRVPKRPEGAWAGGDDLLSLVGVLVQAQRPTVALETGVAMGFTTAVILEAMADNEHGALHSIDLPPLQVDARRFVGQAVPDRVRDRWTLHVGPSRVLLGDLARRLAPIDVFIHDADHGYQGMRLEFETVWPHLAVGGVLISDDVANDALPDFAHAVGEVPYLVAPRPDAHAAVGMIRKTAASR